MRGAANTIGARRRSSSNRSHFVDIDGTPARQGAWYTLQLCYTEIILSILSCTVLGFQNSMNPIPPTKPARSMAPNAPDVRWIAPLPGPWSEPLPPEVNVAVAGTREILMEEVIVYYGGSAGDHETGALTLMTIPACPLVVSVPVCVKVITTTTVTSSWPTDSTLLSQSQSQTCFLWYDFTLEHSLL
jgi:hypothetical protein